MNKDDPFYIECKLKELENTLTQMERENDTSNAVAVMQQMEKRREQLDALRSAMWNPPDLSQEVKT